MHIEHSDSRMQCSIDLACGSFLSFGVVSCHGVDVIIRFMMGHDYVVISSGGGIYALFMQELHCTPLAAHPGVYKTVDLLFACV